MWKLVLLLLIQAGVPPQREIVGPYTFREDQGQTTKVVLKNGLTVIVREEYAVPLASITTLVKTGYFNEDDPLAGISHVIERMLFRGTEKRPASEVGRQTRALGGVLDATTDYEQTVFNAVVPAGGVLPALDIQSDALLHPSFDPDELKREIERIVQEHKSKVDNPDMFAREKLHETAFTEHRIKRWSTGTPDGLRALTADDITAFYQKYYRPSNTILTIVGAFDREKILEGVVRFYGGAENISVEPDASPSEPRQESPRYASSQGDIRETHVAIGFHAPEALSQDARALEVLAGILGTGRTSRFNQILRDEKNIITFGSARSQAFRDLGYFEVDLETAAPSEAAVAALAEIENVKRFGVSGESVSRAKAAIAQNYFERLETVSGLAGDLAYYESLGDWKLSSAYLPDIQRITPQRVQDVARRYLTAANLSVFEYLPEAIDRGLTAADYKTAVLDKVDAAVARRNEEELPVTAQIPQRGNGLVTDAVGTIRRQSILRGPEVYILEDHRLPLVSFGIFFPGGRLMETPENAGITELTLRSALRGTKSFDSSTLARQLENAGARIDVVNEPDFFGYVLHGLAGRMDQAIQVLVEVLQDPLFEEPEVESERRILISRIRKLRDDNATLSTSLFMKALYGGGPYGRPAIGTEAGVEKVTGTEIRTWFRNNQRKLLPTIVIVGDTRGTALVAPIADALTNEDLEPRDLMALPRAQLSTETLAVEVAKRQQTTVVYGFPGVNGAANERYAVDVLVHAIRDKQSLTGQAETGSVAYSRGGAVYTSLAVSPEKENEVRDLLDAEHERLRKEGLSDAELRRAAQSAIGARNASLQTREARLLEYARAIYSGAGFQAVGRYDAGVQAVTADRFKAVIQQVMDPAGLRLGIVRGIAQ